MVLAPNWELRRFTSLAAVLLLAACAPGGDGAATDGGTPGVDASRPDGSAPVDGSIPVGCDPSEDMDGDGIADAVEGTADGDGDGMPNREDDDSDGDGLTDAEENAGGSPCGPRHSDEDGTPDYLDADSDNDGLSDREETNTHGTDPTTADSDGDGVSDLAEVRGSGTDPTDPGSTIPEGDFFVVLPHLGAHENRPLRFGTNLQKADVYFLIDTTASMADPIANVRSSLTRIVAELSARIPDVQMGVGRFDDFPLGDRVCPLPFLCTEVPYGDASDVVYEHLQDITGDVSRVQSALDALDVNNGEDCPESQTEALYQTATGMGGSWAHSNGGTTSLSASSCPSGRVGYPCFRPRSLPIVVMVTDADWHQGPSNSDPYSDITPGPHTFSQAKSALTDIGARFVGVTVQSDHGCAGGGRPQAATMARRTGSVDASGTPLVSDAVGGAVSDAIIDNMETLTSSTPQDVNTRTENVAGNPDDFDATLFIKAITPIRGIPPEGITGGMDATTFFGVIPGTEVEFDVDFYNDVRPGAETAEIFQARIIVVGNGVTDLDTRNVYIIVPPDGEDIVLY